MLEKRVNEEKAKVVSRKAAIKWLNEMDCSKLTKPFEINLCWAFK